MRLLALLALLAGSFACASGTGVAPAQVQPREGAVPFTGGSSTPSASMSGSTSPSGSSGF